MIRVVFIEDRILMLRTMKTAVDWQARGIEPIGFFASCDEALPFIMASKPDVVVTDIVMHGMNGLDLSRFLHEQQTDVKVIIVSAYGRFEYAQQALQAGVFDYFEKPLDYEALVQSILRAGSLNLQARRMREFIVNHREFYKERFFTRLLLGNIGEDENPENDAAMLGLESIGGAVVLCCNVKRSNAMEGRHTMDRELLGLQLLGRLEQSLPGQRLEGPYTLNAEESIFLLLNCGADDYEETFARVSDAVSRFSEEIGAVVHAGVSARAESLDQLKQASEEAARAMDACFVSEGTAVMTAHQLNRDSSLTWRRLSRLEEGVLRAISTQDVVALAKAIQDFRQSIEATSVSSDVMRTAVKGMLYKAESQHSRDPGRLAETLASIDGMDTLDDVLDATLVHCTSLVQDVRQGHSRHLHVLLDAARADIEEHFSEEGYGLNELAQHLNLSPSYLSALYKKQFGQGVYEAIIALRMERAKQLLIHTGKSIGEVGSAVGYPNPYHFSNSFRKYAGSSPSEYRNRNRA